MVTYQRIQIGEMPIREAVEMFKTVGPDPSLTRTARASGICCGDESTRASR